MLEDHEHEALLDESMKCEPKILTNAYVQILFGFLLVVSATALYFGLTKEVITEPGTKTVIVGAGLLDDLMHRDGVLFPGSARVSTHAKLARVIDGHKEAGIEPDFSVTTRDGKAVLLGFTFDFQVEEPKLLVDRFTIHWQFDHLWPLITDCIGELALEHDYSYFQALENHSEFSAELENKVKKALIERAMPVSVSNFQSRIKPRGSFRMIGGKGSPGQATGLGRRKTFGKFPGH
jgi:hypothetical protein